MVAPFQVCGLAHLIAYPLALRHVLPQKATEPIHDCFLFVALQHDRRPMLIALNVDQGFRQQGIIVGVAGDVRRGRADRVSTEGAVVRCASGEKDWPLYRRPRGSAKHWSWV